MTIRKVNALYRINVLFFLYLVSQASHTYFISDWFGLSDCSNTQFISLATDLYGIFGAVIKLTSSLFMCMISLMCTQQKYCVCFVLAKKERRRRRTFKELKQLFSTTSNWTIDFVLLLYLFFFFLVVALSHFCFLSVSLFICFLFIWISPAFCSFFLFDSLLCFIQLDKYCVY